MKLAQIILPKDTPHLHATLHATHMYLEAELAKHWNGFTAMPAKGFWQDPNGNGLYEEVIVYMVAMERADVIHLRELAERVAKLGGQDCVMIVTPNGDVEFIKNKEKYGAQGIC